jgi:hypothetical protein
MIYGVPTIGETSMNLIDIITKAKAEKATSLDLSQQDLRILPKELFEIESLE